jgi:Flp pilus assembly protein TadG
MMHLDPKFSVWAGGRERPTAVAAIARRALSAAAAALPSPLVRLLRQPSGNAAIEFALIAPFLMAVLIGVVDLGTALYKRMEVVNAAHAGAQYAVVKGWDSTAIQNAVTAATSLASISASPAPMKSCGCANGMAIAIATCGSACPSGAVASTYVTVSAQAPYTPLFIQPWLGGPTTLTAQSMVRIQ